MKRSVRRHRAHQLLGLTACCAWFLVAASGTAQVAPLRDAQGFLQAGPGRVLALPQDHGAHPDTRTEWWYLTGPLRGPAGELFGFQATWFRRAVVRDVPAGRSPLATRDVILFHGALTDVAEQRFRFAEQASRAYEPWAHASTDRMNVGIFQQTLRDASGAGQAAALSMTTEDARVELELDLVSVPPLLHGTEPGLSVKGHAPGQASWYYSLPGVTVRGTLHREGQPPLPLTGNAWFDHEFGSSQLGETQQGWDWFSVVLDDDSQLMLYEIRLRDGSPDSTSSGTLRLADGSRRPLTSDHFRIRVSEHWTSSRTGVRYPAAWVIEVPTEDLILRVRPLLSDQELQTPGTTGVTYWEGLCRFEGTRAGEAVGGEGYVELVGYGEAISSRFQPAR